MPDRTKSQRAVHRTDPDGRETTANTSGDVDVVVAGHLCVDIIPTLTDAQQRADDLFLPGQLIEIGPAMVSLGGAVSNVGQAMHRLGFVSRLVGKIGDDALGQMIARFLQQLEPALAEHLVVSPGDASSYTIVLNPPGVDRCFLHCTGANDTFAAAECPLDVATSGRLFHFGYPPLMRQIYADQGVGLAQLMKTIQDAGVLTSLDLAFPDPSSAAGKVDWRGWLQEVLPKIDVFLPSFDEVLLMLDPVRYHRLIESAAGANPAAVADVHLVSDLAAELSSMGVAVVGLKLGDEGLFLKTSGAGSRFAARSKWSSFPTEGWDNVELLAPCFEVNVAGTTGSGDCTVAGFLGGLLNQLSAAEAARHAVAVGAFNVESHDATSGIGSWKSVERRLASRWPRRRGSLNVMGWSHDERTGTFRSTE